MLGAIPPSFIISLTRAERRLAGPPIGPGYPFFFFRVFGLIDSALPLVGAQPPTPGKSRLGGCALFALGRRFLVFRDPPYPPLAAVRNRPFSRSTSFKPQGGGSPGWLPSIQ